MNTLTKFTGSLALATLVAAAPFAAFAQSATVSADVTTSTKGTASITKIIARADQEIERRLTNLNSLSTRIGALKNVSASEKTSLQTSLSTEVGNLTGLKATIDADTDITKLKTDVKSITSDYRIYMLVLPQGRIAAATDRITTLVSDMQQLGTKLSTRISEAQSAGKDVSGAQSAYADMQAKVSDASTQSQAALSETENLTPDQGNATVEASNTAAIKDAAAKIKTATADLKAARADITTIMAAVKGTGGSGTASTSVTAQ